MNFQCITHYQIVFWDITCVINTNHTYSVFLFCSHNIQSIEKALCFFTSCPIQCGMACMLTACLPHTHQKGKARPCLQPMGSNNQVIGPRLCLYCWSKAYAMKSPQWVTNLIALLLADFPIEYQSCLKLGNAFLLLRSKSRFVIVKERQFQMNPGYLFDKWHLKVFTIARWVF